MELTIMMKMRNLFWPTFLLILSYSHGDELSQIDREKMERGELEGEKFQFRYYIKTWTFLLFKVFCWPVVRGPQWHRLRSTFLLRDLSPHSSVSCSLCPRPGGIIIINNNNNNNNDNNNNKNNKGGITPRPVSWPAEADLSSKPVSSGTMVSGCTHTTSRESDTRPRTSTLMKASSWWGPRTIPAIFLPLSWIKILSMAMGMWTQGVHGIWSMVLRIPAQFRSGTPTLSSWSLRSM